MKKVLVGIGVLTIIVAALALIYFVVMPTGGMFGKKTNEIKRDVYETNPQYIKGKADDLADYMYQYNTTEDENEKKSICQVVNRQFADFDLNGLNDLDLINFARSCKTGGQ